MEQTQELATRFAERGYLPARPILDEAALEHFRAFPAEDARLLAEANRTKTQWMADRTTLEAARHPRITEVLDALLGEAGYYYLWGAQVIDRVPGQVHAWHTDIETAREGLVSLWIGVNGVSAETSLAAVPGSHLLGEPLQAVWPSGDPARSDPEGAAIQDHLRGARGAAEVARIDCTDGEGIFFDGRLWHGTFNTSDTTRRALLLQYGQHGTPVRTVRDASAYPFEFETEKTPQVLPLRGSPDPVANKNMLVGEDGKVHVPPATVGAAPKLGASPGQAWTMIPYFRAETPVMQHLSCHASVLRGGFMPHLPHAHDDEEILIVLSGKAAIFAQHDDKGVWRGLPASAGDFLYSPRGHVHTIMNPALEGDAPPVAYLMFRWRTRRPADGAAKPFAIRRQDYMGERRLWTDQPSSGLGKLHIYFSRLAPGQAFGRHLDRYDSTFVVPAGELTVLERTLGPGGAFLTRAGELHDTVNRGKQPCEYLVFEFHDHEP